MKSSQVNQEDLIYTTTAATNDDSTDVFVVELFDYSPDLSCDGIPKKIIKNFDDLIDFFEAID